MNTLENRQSTFCDEIFILQVFGCQYYNIQLLRIIVIVINWLFDFALGDQEVSLEFLEYSLLKQDYPQEIGKKLGFIPILK